MYGKCTCQVLSKRAPHPTSPHPRVPKKWNGPLQYEDKKTQQLMMLPSDLALLSDRTFKVGLGCFRTGSWRRQCRNVGGVRMSGGAYMASDLALLSDRTLKVDGRVLERGCKGVPPVRNTFSCCPLPKTLCKRCARLCVQGITCLQLVRKCLCRFPPAGVRVSVRQGRDVCLCMLMPTVRFVSVQHTCACLPPLQKYVYQYAKDEEAFFKVGWGRAPCWGRVMYPNPFVAATSRVPRTLPRLFDDG